MSADNWGVCPRCEVKRHQAVEDKRAEVDRAYGVLPVGEFDALREELGGLEAAKPQYVLREDYELGILPDGEFYVIYKGRCAACDFSHEFHHEEKVS